MKGSVALLAGALPVLFSCPQEITPRRPTTCTGGGPAATAAAAASAAAWASTPTPFAARRRHTGTRTSSSAARRARPASARCRQKRRAAGAEPVRFGSSSLAEGPAWASATSSGGGGGGGSGGSGNSAAAGLDREPAATRGRRVGGGGIGASAAGSGSDDAAVDAFASSAVPTAVDEGELTCGMLEGVVSREAALNGQGMVLRVAKLDDYFAIADVRFDVFSPVHSTLKHRFRERSCLLMRERRRKGAFCLVAALDGPARERAKAAAAAAAADRAAASQREGGGVGLGADPAASAAAAAVETAVSDDHVLGTLECSRHEFDGTPLVVEVEEQGAKIARLYLTEVAVRSDCRRMGVGRVLLELVDDVARALKTSEVFLHVNEINEAALRLYARCGYEEAPNCASNRAFTNSLGLSGGFIGQRHLLLHKTFPDTDDSDGDGGN